MAVERPAEGGGPAPAAPGSEAIAGTATPSSPSPSCSGARRRLNAGGPDSCSAPSGCGLLALTEDERQRTLSFAADLASAAALAACCRRCRAAGRSPAAWEGATVEVGCHVLSDPESAEKLVALGSQHWGLAREVRLPPCRLRRSVEQRLREAWPRLRFAVAGEGPYLLFSMGAEDFREGTCTALHFFEPRYRWMCSRLSEAHTDRPPVFGWVTSGRPCYGARGSLCEVMKLTANRGGTFDVSIRAKAAFKLVEVWTETAEGIPRTAPLSVGYVKRLEAQPPLPRRYFLSRDRGWEGSSDSDDPSSDSELNGLLGADAVDHLLVQLVSQGSGPGGLELNSPGGGDSGEDGPEGSDLDSEDS
mmetsp:Transcript_36100/g.112244  ORF Transcript_36100/g.112244 Transcript_36100/m.112244 type:complete len:361 (-) Transcript_36100:83-1165(-)